MIFGIPLEIGFYGTKKTGLEIGYGAVMFLNGADRLTYLKAGIRLNKSSDKIVKVIPMLFFARGEDQDHGKNTTYMQPWIGISFGKYF